MRQVSVRLHNHNSTNPFSHHSNSPSHSDTQPINIIILILIQLFSEHEKEILPLIFWSYL